MQTETVETHIMHEHVTHVNHAKSDLKTFYTVVGIIAFCVIVLQPLAMLIVIFMQAMIQGQ